MICAVISLLPPFSQTAKIFILGGGPQGQEGHWRVTIAVYCAENAEASPMDSRLSAVITDKF